MIAVKETGYLHMGSVKNAEDGKKYIQSVERALKIMNLIADQGKRILLADSSCNDELNGNADQMHGNDNKEYFPEDA